MAEPLVIVVLPEATVSVSSMEGFSFFVVLAVFTVLLNGDKS